MPKVELEKTQFEETIAMVVANGVIITSRITWKQGEEPIHKHIELSKKGMLKLHQAITDAITGR